jgi:hypothetical protein
MQNEPIDTSGASGQNTSSTQNGEDGLINIDMSVKTPLNDPNCEHKNVVKDPTEELGDAFMCQDCHIGWIMQAGSQS